MQLFDQYMSPFRHSSRDKLSYSYDNRHNSHHSSNSYCRNNSHSHSESKPDGSEQKFTPTCYNYQCTKPRQSKHHSTTQNSSSSSSSSSNQSSNQKTNSSATKNKDKEQTVNRVLSDSDEPSNDDVSTLNCKNRINGKLKNYNVFLKGSVNDIACDFEIKTGDPFLSSHLTLFCNQTTSYVTVKGIENVPMKAPCYVLPVTINGVTDQFTLAVYQGLPKKYVLMGRDLGDDIAEYLSIAKSHEHSVHLTSAQARAKQCEDAERDANQMLDNGSPHDLSSIPSHDEISVTLNVSDTSEQRSEIPLSDILPTDSISDSSSDSPDTSICTTTTPSDLKSLPDAKPLFSIPKIKFDQLIELQQTDDSLAKLREYARSNEKGSCFFSKTRFLLILSLSTVLNIMSLCYRTLLDPLYSN